MTNRLCFVIDSLNGGGAEIVALRLVETINLLAGDVRADLIVLSTRGDYQVDQSDFIHFLPFSSNKNLDGFFKRKKVIAQFTETLGSLESSGGAFSAIFSNLDVCHGIVRELPVSTPKYYIIHSSPVLECEIEKKRGWYKLWRLKRRKMALKNQSLICVSKGVASDFPLPWLPVGDVRTIYNPFDVEAITHSALQQLDDIPKQPYILHVGRVCAAKRHDRLLAAFQQLNTDHQLVLLTKNSNKLKKLIARFGLERRVIVAGFQANPYPWMKQAKLVVLSSDYEGLPNVLVESLLCGTPFVSTDCKHGPREILADYKPDWLSKDFSPESLAGVMATVLANQEQIAIEQWPMYPKIQAQYSAMKYIEIAKSAN